MANRTATAKREFSTDTQSQFKRGSCADAAAKIARRIVDKQRRHEGKTPSNSTQGTGNPNKKLQDSTVAELRNLASQHHIEGRSKMRKSELIDALGGRR